MRIYANNCAARGDIGARRCTCNGLYVNATVHLPPPARSIIRMQRAIRCIAHQPRPATLFKPPFTRNNSIPKIAPTDISFRLSPALLRSTLRCNPWTRGTGE